MRSYRSSGFATLTVIWFCLFLGSAWMVMRHFINERRRALKQITRSQKRLEEYHLSNIRGRRSWKITFDHGKSVHSGNQNFSPESSLPLPTRHQIMIDFGGD